jgi:hypothetical protein
MDYFVNNGLVEGNFIFNLQVLFNVYATHWKRMDHFRTIILGAFFSLIHFI